MAIDTPQKRADTIAYGQVYMLAPKIPDGGIDTVGERQITLWGYSGVVPVALVRRQKRGLLLGVYC